MSLLKNKKSASRPVTMAGGSLLLESSGSFWGMDSQNWRLGKWQAQLKSCSFIQGREVVWTLLYTSISKLEEVTHPFGFGKQKALKIVTEGSRGISQGLLLTPELDRWHQLLKQKAFPEPISEAHLFKIAQAVDSMSEQLMWTLWEVGHASLESLCQVLCVTDSAEVLQKIKEVINPVAKEVLGYEILVFKLKAHHPVTAQEIHNSWWLVNSSAQGHEDRL